MLKRQYLLSFWALVLSLGMAFPTFAAPISSDNSVLTSAFSTINALRVLPDQKTSATMSFFIGGATLKLRFSGYFNEHDGYSEISSNPQLVSNPSGISYTVTSTNGASLVDLDYNGEHAAYIVGLQPNGKWTNTRY